MRSLYFFLVLTLSVLVSSCKLDDQWEQMGMDSESLSSLALVNAYSGSAALSMYLDDREFTYESKPLLFRDYFPYRNILPGERNITIFQAGSSSRPVELYAAKESFKPGVLYSIFVTGSNKVELLKVEDEVYRSSDGAPKLRVINLSTTQKEVLIKGLPWESKGLRLTQKEYTDFHKMNPTSVNTLYLSPGSEKGEQQATLELEKNGVYSLILLDNNGSSGNAPRSNSKQKGALDYILITHL